MRTKIHKLTEVNGGFLHIYTKYFVKSRLYQAVMRKRQGKIIEKMEASKHKQTPLNILNTFIQINSLIQKLVSALF